MDMLASFSETLMSQLGSQKEKGDTLTMHLPNEDQSIEAVMMAARLADVAVQEMGYRFWIQENETPKRKRK